MENRTAQRSFTDETGNVYGGWTVIERGPSKKGRCLWLCRCICGTEGYRQISALRCGDSKSCGCLAGEAISRAGITDITGERYGRLVAIRMVEVKDRFAMWECQCDCGKVTICRGSNLRNGKTKSCGCLRIELLEVEEYESSFNRIVANMKYSAQKRGYEWHLSNEEVREITKRNCFYCGIGPEQICGHKKESFPNGIYTYNGIDRIDNARGYIIDNVVACCRWCNYAKKTRTISEFREWVIRVYENFKINAGVTSFDGLDS